MSPSTPPCLLDNEQMQYILQRLAKEIAASLDPGSPLLLLGIRSRGLPLAQRLQQQLSTLLQQDIALGALDITFYRDDLQAQHGLPKVRSTEIPCRLQGRTVLLVDDVLFTGRTIRAALDALLDHGRPHCVRLAVLVDRGGRELPIQADFTGVRLEVPPAQRVAVRLQEIDGLDGIYLGHPQEPR